MPKGKDSKKKPKRKPKGSAAVDAKVFSGGVGGGKGAGKVKVAKSVSLAKSATGKADTVNARVTRDSDSFSPTERAAERKSDANEPQLAKGLAAIAAGVKPGKGSIGAVVSGGLTGAALGATIGEEIGRGKRAKAKAKKKKEDEL